MPHSSRRMTQRRFTYDQALALMREYNSGSITCSALAERENVDRKTLWNMLQGITYRDIWITAQREIEKGPGCGWAEPRKQATSNKPTSLKLKQIIAALQSRPGQWALVKQTKKKPQVAYWQSKGLETACRRLDGGDWGVYARWPEAEAVPNVA